MRSDAIWKGGEIKPFVRLEVVRKVPVATGWRRTADDESRVGQLDDLPTFGRREAVAHRLRCSSELPRRQRRFNEPNGVRQGDGDKVPETNTELLVRPRQTIGSLFEFLACPRADHAIWAVGRHRWP